MKVDGAVHGDFDYFDFLPSLFYLLVAQEVVFKQGDVIFANGCTEQLAKIGKLVIQVSGR